MKFNSANRPSVIDRYALWGASLFFIIALMVFHPFHFPRAMAQGNGKTGRFNGELNVSIRVNFGVRGTKPLVWDGSASVSEGKILGVRGCSFDEEDALFPKENRWRCSIERLRGREYAQNLKPGVRVREFMEELMGKGVELDISATQNATLTISTAAGNFSFPLSDLVLGRTIDLLEGNLKIELIPRPHQTPQQGEIQNYPALASDTKGNVWLAWVSYTKGQERLMIAKFNGSTWGNPVTLDKGKNGCLTPALACKPDGSVLVVWPAREERDWDLFMKQYSYEKGSWSGATRLAKNSGPDANPAMTVDAAGKVYLCWQGTQNGNTDIFLLTNNGKGWGQPFQVTDHPGNDWEPDICSNSKGALLIAWESFRDGMHKILAREFIGEEINPEITLASSQNYVAHASVTSDMDGRFWIAWDEAGQDWGFGEQEEEKRTISINKFDEVSTQIDYDKVAVVGRRGRYNSRNLGLICLNRGKLYKPAHDLLESLSVPMQMYADIPKTLTDPQGRLWIIFHHYVGKMPFYVHNQLMEVWKVYAVYYDGLRWSDPIPMPHNTWRQLRSASLCIDQGGHLWTAYPQDWREIEKRETRLPALSVSSLALPAGDKTSIPTLPYNNSLIEEADYMKMNKSSRGPAYITEIGNGRYTLYWGSLHDVHDVRGRMNLDGFTIDSFKYAMDDWGYDFLGLKDYVYRNENWFTDKNYNWQETQKVIDLFTIKDSFQSFFLKGKSPYLRVAGHSLLKKSPPKGMPLIMGVYAERLSEEALVDAIDKKRSYLATDKILLDFWIAGHPMGDKFKSVDRFPKMEAKVVGTTKLKRVDILRNAECIYSTEPDSNEIHFTFVDMNIDPSLPGEYHYFLQAFQENGGMAWSPPACFHYFPGYANQ